MIRLAVLGILIFGAIDYSTEVTQFTVDSVIRDQLVVYLNQIMAYLNS